MDGGICIPCSGTVWHDDAWSSSQHGFILRDANECKIVFDIMIAEQMEMHVHGFCLIWLDFSINNGLFHGIVGLVGCHWLCMSMFVEDDPDIHSFSSHDVKHCKFSFGRGCHVFNDVNNLEDGTIVGWNACIGR